MKFVEGFEAAKGALVRPAPFFDSTLELAVREIINGVRARGDAAIREYTQRFENIRLGSLEVSRQAVKEAPGKLDPNLRQALELAAGRIRDFHLAQKKEIYSGFASSGCSQFVRPLRRVGIYVPGGSAYYPSTVLMTAIPAKAAGVPEVIVVTPPGADGAVPAPVLAAAAIARVGRVFAAGGAQAIAALAFGTETIPRVDKICGPGGIYVVLAKKLVFGVVDIDALQGPSEILIIADDTADPAYCAADMLAQAEHDRLASTVLITTSGELAQKVIKEIECQIEQLSRKEIIQRALDNQGVIAVVDSLEEAIDLANIYAPEHLSLMVRGAEKYVEEIISAGCIFIGGESPVALGDYVAGPSHALPTGGTARFGSPLNVLDFLKITDVVNIEKSDLGRLRDAAGVIARAEGFEAHARALEKRERSWEKPCP